MFRPNHSTHPCGYSRKGPVQESSIKAPFTHFGTLRHTSPHGYSAAAFLLSINTYLFRNTRTLRLSKYPLASTIQSSLRHPIKRPRPQQARIRPQTRPLPSFEPATSAISKRNALVGTPCLLTKCHSSTLPRQIAVLLSTSLRNKDLSRTDKVSLGQTLK